MSLTKVTYSMINGSPVNVLDYGVDATGATDSTSGLQAAITAASALKRTLYIPSGTYKYTTLTVADQITIIGDGPSSILYTTNTTVGGITVTTTSPVIFEKLTLTSAGSQTGGAYITISPASGENASSIFKDLTLSNYYIGIKFVAASLWTVQTCYFGTAGITGARSIWVQNTYNVDSGDSTITGNIFYFSNNVGTHINHFSSGGLRVINNKFLYGQIHYHMELSAGASTFDLLFANNSTEHAATGNLVFDRGAGATFSNVLINNNEYTVTDGKYGILVNNSGGTWLDGVSIGGEVFGSNSTATAIALNDVQRAVINTNTYRMGGSSSAIYIGSNVSTTNGVKINTQNYCSITTPVDGNITFNGNFIDFSKNAFFAIASGSTKVITLDRTLVNSVASVTVGGVVDTVGTVTGQYIVSGTSTVTTLNAIANVTVTTNGTSITVTNNTGHSFSGRILINY